MRIPESLRAKRLEGFFCETILTVEGQPLCDDTVTRVLRALDLGIAAAIEARGSGYARVSKVARSDSKQFARAVAEWADGDNVAAHHSYANDLFCTQDRAVRAGRHSVLHPANRGWSRRVYAVEFVTIAQLAQRLERFD